MGEDDIVFLDFGPVFEAWEGDFGRTYVLGNDPLKHKLRRDIEQAFASGKQYFHEDPEIALSSEAPDPIRAGYQAEPQACDEDFLYVDTVSLSG